MSSSATWLASCLSPIPGDLPAGRDPRHEPEHERIRMQIESAGGLTGKAVDWQAVLNDGQLLHQKAKDLLIASYMALASAKLEGLVGLTNGLLLLSGLLERFPEGLHPQRARARGNALSWLSERVAELTLPEQCTRAEADALKGAYRALSANMRERLGDDSPTLTELGRLIDRLALGAAEPIAPPPMVAPPSPEQTSRAVPSATSEPELLAPISAESPAGGDASQHDAYFAAQAEVEKLQSLDGLKPSWPSVAVHATELLRSHSKDFLIAGYLTVALLETEGPSGLQRGLTLMVGLLDGYWEQGFPPLARVKRRANALSWLIERLATALPRVTPSAVERAQLEEAVRAFAAALDRRLPNNDAVSLVSLRSALAALPIAEAPAASPFSGPALSPASELISPAPVATTETPVAPAIALPEAPAFAEVSGIEPFLTSSGERLADAARALFEANVADARAYRLLRVGLWLELDELPAATTDAKQRGRTRVRPPERRAREALQAMAASGRWDAVLLQSEGVLRQNPLWLETCWLSARALAELGDSHAAALAAVEAESRALVARLPQLLELQFLDGTPFASSEAAAWFRGGLTGTAQIAEADPVQLAWQSAQQAALGEGSPDALRRIDELLRQAPSAREAFRMRLSLAKSMEEAGRLDGAGYVYLGLERDIDSHDLERWEPELAREVFSRLWSLLSRRALTVSAADAQRVCARLAKLSPFALA